MFRVIRLTLNQKNTTRFRSPKTSTPSRMRHVILSDGHVPLPYRERKNETIDCKRSRLHYQSRKRGTLESGLILSTFAAKFLDNFTASELCDYDYLINGPSNEWDIYYWATGVTEPPLEYRTEVMELIKKHAQNDDRVMRIKQPDLYA